MDSAGNRTDNQDILALRRIFIRIHAMTQNRAPNPQNPSTFEIWTFRAESHQNTVPQPAESMHFQSAWGRLQRNNKSLLFVHDLAGQSRDYFYKNQETSIAGSGLKPVLCPENSRASSNC